MFVDAGGDGRRKGEEMRNGGIVEKRRGRGRAGGSEGGLEGGRIAYGPGNNLEQNGMGRGREIGGRELGRNEGRDGVVPGGKGG